MKKALLFVAAISGALHVCAQPTITAAGCNPVAGETFYGRYCSTTGVTLGATGAGVTWNMAGLTVTDYDTVQYQACAGTPYCDTFPGSTLAVQYDDEYDYFVTDATKFAATGFGMPSGGSQYYSDPISYMVYPMLYNTVKIDSYVSSQPAFQTYSYGIDTFKADAYGTLILPTGTYNNVLRVHMIAISTDSMDFTTPAMVSHRRSDIYMWYKEGFHNPLMTMYYDTSGTGVSHLGDVSYYLYTPSGIDKVKEHTLATQVYPNPAMNEVHIKMHLNNGGKVSIAATDMAGRAVGYAYEEFVNGGTTDMKYDIAGLPNGMYILKIQTAEGTDFKKIQVNK